MILALLALGLGVALAAYEFSPGVHARADDYVRAIRAAHAAHSVADVHLHNLGIAGAAATQHAQAAVAVQRAAGGAAMPGPQIPSAPMPQTPAPSPAPVQDLANAHMDAAQVAADIGVDLAIRATEANQAAAVSTVEAVKRATTAAERILAAQSAAQVVEREKKIAAALVSFGVGQCGIRAYAHVTARTKDQLLTKLHEEGMGVTGDNPWSIETHQYNVRLRAVWDPSGQTLKLAVTAGMGGYAGLVTCDEIWKRIDPIVRGVVGA